jgi:hypothetical protein
MDYQRSILKSDWFYHKTPYGEHERVQEGWQAISELAFFYFLRVCNWLRGMRWMLFPDRPP